MSGAYYNEIDPFAAQWLRNLIAAGHIAAGDVDERSIVDVAPADLAGYTQCHFFAGVGVWSYALRLAGWSDDRPIWTGSCPCQPFSAAGKGKGFDDERHLWPAFGWLIQECRPAIVTGEQVASKDAEPWLDLVQADLEAMGYRFGAVPFPSAGVGAPHIRDRLYWVADADSREQQGVAVLRGNERNGPDAGWAQGGRGTAACGEHGWLAHSDHQRCVGQHPLLQREEPGRLTQDRVKAPGCGAAEWLANNNNPRLEGRGQPGSECVAERAAGTSSVVGRMADTEVVRRKGKHLHTGGRLPPLGAADSRSDHWASPTHGFWRDADWLLCRDGKWRPVEPGTFPLAHGAPSRVGRLRAYGNAINAQAARAFIEVMMECIP